MTSTDAVVVTFENEVSSVRSEKATIRRVLLNDKHSMRQVGKLHIELLKAWGPMMALGERFVREACYAVNMRDGLLEVDLFEVDGVAAGFVAYTARSITFHRASLRRYWPRVVAELILAIISKPGRVLGLLRAVNVIASRRSEVKTSQTIDRLGEIVCIGVRPSYLTSKFVKATGIRISERLIEHAASYMRRAGADNMRMLVDKPNKAALFLYHKLGAQFNNFTQAGTPMVEVVFKLDQLALGVSRDLPTLWQFNSGSQSQLSKGWRSYWERVADNERIFRYEADDYFERLLKNVDTTKPMRMLDFGCGYGFVASRFAACGHSVSVWDGSSNARRQSRFRLAPFANVDYIDLSEDRWIDAFANCFDMITVHSVIQYMSPDEISQWLKKWRSMLVPGGRLLISDIIPPGNATLPELFSLLILSVKKHFFISALWECIRETPYYWSMRNSLSLMAIDRDRLESLASEQGYGVTILPQNLSHRSSRLSAIFEKIID